MHLPRLSLCVMALVFALSVSCNKKNGSTNNEMGSGDQQEQPALSLPVLFVADSAYSFVESQVAFGVRVPGTEGHTQCAQWITDKLTAYGAQVQQQRFTAKAFTGETLQLVNIIGSYNPDAPKRVLLMAHWDTRPWADQDPNPDNHKTPFLGADDGGSGVAVLLEIARYLGSDQSNVGVDLLFFDGEDYGQYSDEESWCLGSTYWSKNPHTSPYKAQYGILFDMVGAKGAQFYWEGFSKEYAAPTLMGVWDLAKQAGYAHMFVSADGGFLTDDHLPVIKYLGIPSIDIVNHSPHSQNGFGLHWHTMKDNLDNISKETLGIVGNVALNYILQESKE